LPHDAGDPLSGSHQCRHPPLEQHNQLVSRFKSEDAIKWEGGIVLESIKYLEGMEQADGK
jgi:hypothetical protein